MTEYVDSVMIMMRINMLLFKKGSIVMDMWILRWAEVCRLKSLLGNDICKEALIELRRLELSRKITWTVYL